MYLRERAESHSATVNDCYPESFLKSDVRKELSTHHDRTESDNRVEVTLLDGMAENNLPHIVR